MRETAVGIMHLTKRRLSIFITLSLWTRERG
jgi:hypothetical protein